MEKRSRKALECAMTKNEKAIYNLCIFDNEIFQCVLEDSSNFAPWYLENKTNQK